MKTKLTKRILALLLTLVMVLSLLPAAFAEGNHHPFQDVPDGKWYSEAVQYVYENGLMNGTSSTTFDPSGKLTRAMLVTVLYRAAGQPAVEFTPKFSDVPAGRYYSVPVVWAVENGVTNGVSATKFNPNGAVTREQLAKFLYSYAKLMSFEAAARADLSVFPDAAEAHSWAVEPLQWAVAEGIINGVLTGSGETARTLLQPRATATRAQVAVMLMRFFQTHTAPDLGEDAVILYTNDVHTYIDKALGYDNIAGLKKAIARTNDVILVDAGDHIQGTAFGAMDKGKTIVDLMNAADYDLATLGNHEFDYTMEGCMNTIEWANFPYVSCNFYHEENGVRGENVLDAYKVFELGGRKVALIGITTPESFTKSTPAYFQDENGNYIYGISGGEDGSALYADVQAAIDAAKAEADVVIALGHLGIDPSSSPWTSKELIANTTGLDAFIDGHSHSTVEQEIVKDQAGSDVVLTQTGCYFGAIGMMRIAPDGTISTELITECEYSDPAVKEIQDNWIDEINGRLGEVIGHTALTFDNYDETGRLVRKMETNTGDFTADALYYLFDSLDYDVDVAFMNGGGVRNRAITGDISYLSCKNIHTFGNVACLQTVTGQQILDALEWGARSTDAAECGGFLQVSGLKYKVDPTIPDTTQKDDKGVWTGGPTGEYRVYDVEVFQDGEWVDLDLDAEYNLAGYNYTLRDLGDGFNMFNGAVNVIDYVMEDYMVLANYVKAFPIPEGATLPEIEGTNSPLVEKFGTDYLDYTNVAPGLRIQIAKQEAHEDSGEDLYLLTSELHDGDQVVVYHPASGMALSNADLSETQTGYRAGLAVTPEDDVIKNPDAAVVWTAEATENGWYLKDAEGRKLSIPSGSRGLVLDGADPEWTISAAAAENCVNLKSTTRAGSSGDPLAIEWYARFSEFTVYFANAESADFALQLYAKAEQTEPEDIIIGGLEANEWTTKYGNIYTSCTAERLQEMGFAYGDIVTVKFLDQTLDLPLVPTFSYVDQGTPALFINKSETGEFEGRLFMAINMGDFTTTYGIATKTTNPDKTWYWTACEGVTFPIVVTLEMKEQGGYATEMAIRDINRTNNREDYPDLTDAEFANFRRITTTGMGDHLYRGSSPINPEIGRNTYADAALEAAGVTVIMNLANDQATAEAYEGFADTYYSNQNVVYLNLGVDFTAADFQSGLATGLRHFAENKGVYYVHCTEGKDRAGFVSALLECLMGATYDEVVADYLKTYTNYYTVVDGVQQPLSQETLDAIANSNIIKTLQTAFGVEDLTTADLAAEAAEYVKAIGLTDDELAALKENLGDSRKLELVEGANDMLKYGHLVIDVSTEDLLKEFAYGDIVTVTVEGYGAVDAPICSNYDDVDTGETLIRAKSGKTNVNLAINYGQIGVQLGIIETAPDGSATKYQVKEGVTFPIYVTIEMKEAGGYADELAIRAMTRDDNHDNRAAAYPDLTDAEYANFRVVTTTGMGEDALYRSSSPINPEIGRNAEADAAAQAAGIKAFMNMADTQAEAEAYAGYADTYYAGQNKIFLGLPVAFTTDEFKTGLADGYRFIASNDGPYLIHCTEGKDRTGLGVAVLEALMGASIEEIKTDYLQTYINYYNVVDGVQQPLTDAQKAAVTNTIVNNLGIIFDADVSTASLADEAEAYLTEIGLTADEQAALKVNLGKSWSSAEPEEPTASYEVAESVSAGDQIIMVYTVGEKFYAMSSDVSENGVMTPVEVTVTDGALTAADSSTVFTLAAGSAEGSYQIQTADGKALNYSGSGTGIYLQDAGSDWTLTPSAGTSRIKAANSTDRYLFVQNYQNALRIKCYTEGNMTASGYYSTATIYKVVNP
ncbi:MAG: tyrosine-protein phosphatase [Oscillospiraceae bacterium]|nr:tyrosine-protein phosphatase [Oscillospiraceae bacterium]